MAAPGYVQTCVAVDTSGTCTETAWMPPAASMPVALPTLEQAEVVGSAFFVGIVSVAIVKKLLKPSKEIE